MSQLPQYKTVWTIEVKTKSTSDLVIIKQVPSFKLSLPLNNYLQVIQTLQLN